MEIGVFIQSSPNSGLGFPHFSVGYMAYFIGFHSPLESKSFTSIVTGYFTANNKIDVHYLKMKRKCNRSVSPKLELRKFHYEIRQSATAIFLLKNYLFVCHLIRQQFKLTTTSFF